ncbi:uncharacterized protein EV422DRAFT_257925 [Fimicolochytrium jonesii]|uniref:uncharacterized protein n=1 Tax=Fimicolochytrium jonesii TaxID=1396493 RepID=UPI0022FE19C1|nr:uncharacterized protein EV422DRAFT_257925 [Fimicolochytrium jonesii]KAI8817167.1 hypothetical protein EV422DRAFT_257925 [Fimicolochytrium jonesii]
MGNPVYAVAIAAATVFALAANVFPDALERLGVSKDWIREQPVSRARRAPVRITQPKSTSDCLNPSFGHAASLFHLFVKDTVASEGESVVHGRLAVGGAADLTGWSIGASIFPQPQTCAALSQARIYPYALTTGSTLTMSSGSVTNGHIGTNGAPSNTTKFQIGDAVQRGLVSRQCGVEDIADLEFDFSETQKEVEMISKKLFELEQTAWVGLERIAPPKMVIKLGGNVTEVAYMDAESLAVSKLVAVLSKPVRMTPGTTIIINIFGSPDIHLSGIDTSILTFPNKILWNFPEATNILFEDTDWYGTVLAPRAHVVLKSARLLGSLYTSSLTSTSSTLKPPAFDGCLPLGHLPSKLLLQRKRRAVPAFNAAAQATTTVTQTVTVTRTKACRMDPTPTIETGEMSERGEVHV